MPNSKKIKNKKNQICYIYSKLGYFTKDYYFTNMIKRG